MTRLFGSSLQNTVVQLGAAKMASVTSLHTFRPSMSNAALDQGTCTVSDTHNGDTDFFHRTKIYNETIGYYKGIFLTVFFNLILI